VHIKKLLAAAFICTAVFAAGRAFADDADDELGVDGKNWINNVPPTSYWGVRGLSQTVAAEPLGDGRFNISVSGSFFNQEQELPRYFKGYISTAEAKADKDSGYIGPGPGSDVTTFRVGASYGFNSFTDLFLSVPLYMVNRKGMGEAREGLTGVNAGAIIVGGQFTFPFPEEMAFRLALHAHAIYGLRNNTAENRSDVSTYNPEYKIPGKFGEPAVPLPISYAGYDFNEIRDNSRVSFVFKVPMSLVAGNLRRAVKLHLNPGIAQTQFTDYPLFIWAGGVEIDPAEFTTIGLELNGRTPVSGSKGFKDPFWFTPTVAYRSPYYSEGLFGWSFVFGADIRLSGETKLEYDVRNPDGSKVADPKIYPLEQYRLFGDFVFSFDFMASKRAEMIRQARANAAERARLKKLAALTAAERDSVTRKAREDSLALAASLAAKAEKARQDSIAMTMSAAEREAQLLAEAEGREAQLRAQSAANEAQLRAQSAASEAQLRAEAERKRIADSAALAEANKRLKEEKAKRSEAEQMLLSTGMIVLDAVYFESGKTTISRNSEPYLRVIAKMLAKYPKLRLEIGGHTDNTGNLQTNINLSQRRAEAVFMFMHSVEPSLAQMLSARGYGPTEPKADNNTAAGREANRRVELKVLNPEVLKEYNP